MLVEVVAFCVHSNWVGLIALLAFKSWLIGIDMKFLLVLLALLVTSPAFANGDDKPDTSQAPFVVSPSKEAKKQPAAPSVAQTGALNHFDLPLHGERLPNEQVKVQSFEIDPLNETEELVITQFSGDEDCCTDIVVITNSLDGWKIVDFSWGLEHSDDTRNFIQDIDGDGSYEIVADKIYRVEDGIVSETACSKFKMIGPDLTTKRCIGL